MSIRWGLALGAFWILVGIGSVFAFKHAYTRTRSLINKLFMCATIAFTSSYVFFLVLSMIPPENVSESFVFYVLVIANICVIIGMILLAEGFIYNQYGDFPYYSQFIVFLAGILVTAITDPTRIRIIYNAKFDVWVPYYEPKPNLLFLFLLLGYLFYHIVFIYKKLRLYATRKAKFDGSILGFIVFIGWLISATIPAWKPLRLVLSGIVLFAISIPVLINPLAYNVTSSLPRAILLSNKDLIPYFLLNVKCKQVKTTTQDLLLVDATAEVITKSLNLPTKPSELASKDFEIKRIDLGKTWVSIIGRKVLPQHIAAIYSIRKEIVNIVGSNLATIGVLSPKKEEILKVLILKVLSQVCYEK
ncbi:MAG: hypothetical protein ACTSX6_12550 [Candidatus Heimdallarchaeaceae archaeon]